MQTTLREIANPAAVAWHWSVSYDDMPEFGTIEHSVTWIRDGHNLYYGTKRETARKWPSSDPAWTNTLIINPERFGFEGTLASARIAARNFVSAYFVSATGAVVGP